jgi:hypothetical protein
MAHAIYKASDGTRLPSVTTINKLLSIGGNEGLIYWANQLGLNGLTLEEGRRTSADVGTLAHAAIEADAKGQPFDLEALHLPDDQHALVVSCIAEWHRWRERTRLRVVASEVSLCSEVMRYGGTLDCICEIEGRLSVLDYKTGGAIYPEHLMQVCAYGQLWTENRGGTIEEYHLLRVGKEDASFHHHSWRAGSPAVDFAAKLFGGALALYPAAQRLKNLVK